MLSRLIARLGALAVVAAAAAAAAPPPRSPGRPGPAWRRRRRRKIIRAQLCTRLEAQLASIDRGARRRSGARRAGAALRGSLEPAAGRTRPHGGAKPPRGLRGLRLLPVQRAAVAEPAVRRSQPPDFQHARQSRPHQCRPAAAARQRHGSRRAAPLRDGVAGAEQLRPAVSSGRARAGRILRSAVRARQRRSGPRRRVSPIRKRRAAACAPCACAPATATISRSRTRRTRRVSRRTRRPASACARPRR